MSRVGQCRIEPVCDTIIEVCHAVIRCVFANKSMAYKSPPQNPTLDRFLSSSLAFRISENLARDRRIVNAVHCDISPVRPHWSFFFPSFLTCVTLFHQIPIHALFLFLFLLAIFCWDLFKKFGILSKEPNLFYRTHDEIYNLCCSFDLFTSGA